jgi:hypothetical protein
MLLKQFKYFLITLLISAPITSLMIGEVISRYIGYASATLFKYPSNFIAFEYYDISYKLLDWRNRICNK